MSINSPFFTIGHSTRSIADFVGLLGASEIETVVDVRSMPRSRANPQFNGEALPAALSGYQIGYEHVPELGGLRGRQRPIADPPNGLWTNLSLRNYADYALTAPFREGLERLRGLGRRRCAVMCAEAVWWRCHRRIIADYLIAAHEAVFHILGPGQVDVAALTPGALVCEDGSVIYPATRPPED